MTKKTPTPVTVSLRIARTTRDLLEQAADLDHRSMSNFVEVLILRHCEASGISASGKRSPSGKAKIAK